MIPVRRQIVVSNPTSKVASEVNVNSAPEVGSDEESEVSLNSRNRIRKSVSEVRMYGVPDVDVGLAAESEGHLFRVPDPNHDTHTDQREIALSSHSALKTSMSHTSAAKHGSSVSFYPVVNNCEDSEMLTLHVDSDGEEKELNDKELVEEGEEEEEEEEEENKNCKSNFDRHRVKLPKVKLSIREKNDRAKQIRAQSVAKEGIMRSMALMPITKIRNPVHFSNRGIPLTKVQLQLNTTGSQLNQGLWSWQSLEKQRSKKAMENERINKMVRQFEELNGEAAKAGVQKYFPMDMGNPLKGECQKSKDFYANRILRMGPWGKRVGPTFNDGDKAGDKILMPNYARNGGYGGLMAIPASDIDGGDVARNSNKVGFFPSTEDSVPVSQEVPEDLSHETAKSIESGQYTGITHHSPKNLEEDEIAMAVQQAVLEKSDGGEAGLDQIDKEEDGERNKSDGGEAGLDQIDKEEDGERNKSDIQIHTNLSKIFALDTFVPHTGSVSFNKHATKKDQFEKFNVKFTEKKYKNYNKEKLAMGTRVNANTEIGMSYKKTGLSQSSGRSSIVSRKLAQQTWELQEIKDLDSETLIDLTDAEDVDLLDMHIYAQLAPKGKPSMSKGS